MRQGKILRLAAVVAVASIAISCVVALASNREEFLFLGELEVGMRGVGKTVVANNEISEFDAEVVGVIDEPGESSDFIIVRVSGEAIGRSGGISQGMSGSPIYVEGKLIGALSRAASWSKDLTPIGLVTAIERMLPLLEEAPGKDGLFDPENSSVLRYPLPDETGPIVALTDNEVPSVVSNFPVSTPLTVTGLSSRAREVLMNGARLAAYTESALSGYLPSFGIGEPIGGLSSLGLAIQPVSGGATANESYSAKLNLEPGSAIGVALATGDISIGSIGTLTYRDDDSVIGFGHRFVRNGESSFPLMTATVYETMKTYEASFKLGKLGKLAGTILEDREAGVGGLIGKQAHLIDLSLVVEDATVDDKDSFEIQIVRDPRLARTLLFALGLAAVDRGVDRIGQGTIEVEYRIDGGGLLSPFVRNDIFFSTEDVAVIPAWWLVDLVTLLQYNDFVSPGLTSISASMTVTEKLNAIHIAHLEIDKPIYCPGDTIHYTVVLQEYRGKSRIESGELLIPKQLVADGLVIRAYGGMRAIESGEAPLEFVDLEDLIQTIEDLPSQDTLTVELFALDPLSPQGNKLRGIVTETTEVEGFVMYDQREIDTLLVLPD